MKIRIDEDNDKEETSSFASNNKSYFKKLINENYSISMQYLIKYTLYDQINLWDEKKLIFKNLDKNDEFKIVSIARQIDYLSSELIEINDKINRINESYKNYYMNFLKLIDDKVFNIKTRS